MSIWGKIKKAADPREWSTGDIASGAIFGPMFGPAVSQNITSAPGEWLAGQAGFPSTPQPAVGEDTAAAQRRKLDDMRSAMLAYQQRRPEVAQTMLNAMANQSGAYQGANNALATMYGGQRPPPRQDGPPLSGPGPLPPGVGGRERPNYVLPPTGMGQGMPPRPMPGQVPPRPPQGPPPGTGPAGVSYQGLPPSPLTPGMFKPLPEPSRYGIR